MLPFRIRIKFGTNSDGLTCSWIDKNCKGAWAIAKEDNDGYNLYFEHEEDALFVWWKWS